MTIKTSRREKIRRNKSISPARWIWDGRLKSKVWNPKGSRYRPSSPKGSW